MPEDRLPQRASSENPFVGQKEMERHDTTDWAAPTNMLTESTLSASVDQQLNQVSSHTSTATSLPSLRWKERLRHFTWTWFTMTMATGGISNVIFNVPYSFPGLYAIGVAFFILNIAFFLFNCTMMGLRAYMWPRNFRSSFFHPTESLFIPAFFISIAVILDGVAQYGLQQGKSGPWLMNTMIAFFWIYVVVSVAASSGIYLLMWSTQVFTISSMTPAWIFPAYPLLLVAPFAASLTHPDAAMAGAHALPIIVGATMVQGAGYCISFMLYSAYLYRLMTHKLPVESSRPSMFISVGPSAFTVSGLIHMANHFPMTLHSDFMGDVYLTGQVVKIMGYWTGIWLYGISVWFFIVSLGAHWNCIAENRLQFSMTWMAFIFPNTALVASTFAVATALDDNRPINLVGCVMACILIAAWLFIVSMLVRAIVLRHILWPQKQEDRDYDTWKSELKAKRLRKSHSPVDDASVGSPDRGILARLRLAPPGPTTLSAV